MDFYVSYEKTLPGSLDDGRMAFLVKPYRAGRELDGLMDGKKLVACIGSIQAYPVGTPLLISGDVSCHQGLAEQKVIVVRQCIEKPCDAMHMSSFLETKYFPGIGPAKAAALASFSQSPDLFSVSLRDGAAGLFAEAGGVGKDEAGMIAKKLGSLVWKGRFVAYASMYGIPCRCASLFYDYYRMDSFRICRDNPYLFRFYDVPFRICDRIALASGLPPDGDARVAALLYEAFRNARGRGDSYYPFAGLVTAVNRISGKSRRNAKLISAFQVGAVLAGDPGHYMVSRDPACAGHAARIGGPCYNVYPADIYRREAEAASHVMRLERSAIQLPFAQGMETEFVYDGVSLSAGQAKAFTLLERSGVAVLTGGPGTGKTTIEKGLLQAFRAIKPDAVTALCAPTAAAAKRMREVTGEDATTIHRLLGIRPDGHGGYLGKNENDRLGQDFVIADEFSMVDDEIFCMLAGAMKNGSLLLVVGDEHQLPSVGVGYVLHDLVRHHGIRCVRLDGVFRQEGAGMIVRNSTAIRNRALPAVREDGAFRLMAFPDGGSMLAMAIKLMKKCYDPSDRGAARIFTTARKKKYSLGAEALNVVMQGIFNPAGSTPAIMYGGTVFAKGDPVIFLRNNYPGGYCNGDEGVVDAVVEEENGRRYMVIKTDDGDIVVSGEGMADVALAYALTVHKAQGGECRTAIVLLPAEPVSLLQNSLVYVAVTRAREKVYVLYQEDAVWDNSIGRYRRRDTFRTAVMSVRGRERRSGLAYRLVETDGYIRTSASEKNG